MKFGIKYRLVALLLVLAVMGVSILLATLYSQRQAGDLRVRLSQVESESFRIADEFRDLFRGVNNILYDPAVWNEFLESSHKLEGWLSEQKPRLTTQREKAALQGIDSAYKKYLEAAKELQRRVNSPGHPSASMADFKPLRAQAQHIFDLGQTLMQAHYDSRKELLNQANVTLTHLHWLVLTSLGLLFLFGLAMAAVVYRDMIAPLRVKLGESQSLIERHEKLASLGMLAAGVAHEIRNPLTAIKAALFIQQKKFLPGSQEHTDAKLVEREILRLERIVNDFLHFARPTDPELTTVQAEVPLRETQLFLAPSLSESRIQIVLEKPAPLFVKVDLAQIKQVLINLVQNAADSMAHGGIITLRARRARKNLPQGETDVVIMEVADTGDGIPPEVEKRLFDPFFTTKKTGTGLGLPIAARIVQKHGGALQYQTQVNRGTTFGIILPQATQ
ncbi:MAG: two-component system sensor histidine kinase NtrB [Limisphaerales bacterium]